jgi:UDP-glucose 4-epimerase
MNFPKTVLVTGVTGLIGSAVAQRLLAAGACVAGLVRPGRTPPFEHQVTGLRFYECDLSNVASLTRLLCEIRPELIVHLAAAGVSDGMTDAEVLLRGNVELTVNLIHAAVEAGCLAFIHTGSCFEYGDVGRRRLTEHDLVAPFSLYGHTKAASVQLALGLARQFRLRLVVFRPFGVYGPGEAPRRLLPQLLSQLLAGKPIELTDGLQVRDLTFVDDVADAFVVAAHQFDQLENLSIYNVCSGEGRTVREVAEAVADLLERPRELLRWGARPNRLEEPRYIVGDPSRFAAATGWQHRHDFALGLRCTVERWLAKSAMRCET